MKGKLLTIIFCFATIYVCAQSRSIAKKAVPQTKADNSWLVYRRSGEMAFKVFEKLNSKTDKNQNFMFSPICLTEALSMIYVGAKGETRNELNKFLGFENISQNDVCNAFKMLNTSRLLRDKKTTAKVSNSLWVDKKIPVVNLYQQRCLNYFGAKTNIVNLSSVDAMERMNSWVNEQTKGGIKKVLNEPLSSDCAMALLNTLYFNGSWSVMFDKDCTRKDTFTAANGAKEIVDMMNMDETEFRYRWKDKFSVAEFEYGNGTFCMDVILPHEGVMLDECLENMTYSKFKNLIKNLIKIEIQELSMPRMNLKCDVELLNIMKNMGLERIFSRNDAELNGITVTEKTYVSEIMQSSLLKVNEGGTIVTSSNMVDFITLDIVEEPIEFKMNRPFAYFIRDRKSGAILFMGRVATLK